MSTDTLVLPEGYSVHPAAELFPLIEGDEFNNLVQSIRQHGVQTPIVYRGTVLLDGRNRLRAVQRLAEEGVQLDPPSLQRDGDGADDIEWIETQNLARRHLLPDERMYLAAQLVELIEARNRQTQAASRFDSSTGKDAAKKKSRGAVTTKSSSPKKRDRKKSDANSTVGQVAAKGKGSMHKARQAVAARKAVEAGDLTDAAVKSELRAGKKLKDVVPKKSGTGSKAKSGPAKFVVIEQEIRTAAIKAWQRLKDRFPPDEHPLLRKTFAAIIRDEQKRFGVAEKDHPAEPIPFDHATAARTLHAAVDSALGRMLRCDLADELSKHRDVLEPLIAGDVNNGDTSIWIENNGAVALRSAAVFAAGVQGKPGSVFRNLNTLARRINHQMSGATCGS